LEAAQVENLADVIRKVSFFSGLSRENLARIVGKFEEQGCFAGEVIVKQGDPGDALYIVQSGAVEVTLEHDGLRVESVAILGPGECFGEMSLFTGQNRTATVDTLVDSVVLKLRKEAWDELLQQHPSLSLHFCRVLSQRLAETDRGISKGLGAFKLILEEFVSSQPPEMQNLLMQTSVLRTLDPEAIQAVLLVPDARRVLETLYSNSPSFVKRGPNEGHQYLEYLREFLLAKLEQRFGKKAKDELHLEFAAYFSRQQKWGAAIWHFVQAKAWEAALELIEAHGNRLLEVETAEDILEWIEAMPHEYLAARGEVVGLRGEAYARLGNLDAAIHSYQEFLTQKRSSAAEALDTAGHYEKLAELHNKKGQLEEALGCLRSGLTALEEGRAMEAVQAIDSIGMLEQKHGSRANALRWRERAIRVAQRLHAKPSAGFYGQNKKWLGSFLALACGCTIWNIPPPPGLDERGIHFLASLTGAVILWVLNIFDEYIVAVQLLFVWVLFNIVPPQTALAGFSESSWFFVLGVLGISAAVTKSGLLYRAAIKVLRLMPPNYRSYTSILSVSGLFVTPLLPDERARVSIMLPLSQLIADLMGFKPLSNASAGLAMATYVGFGLMSFMFLTGTTLCLVGWNLLPETAKASFSWGDWALAAFPAGALTLVVLLIFIYLLYPFGEQDRISFSPKSLQTQLEIMGPLTNAEWVSLVVLVLALLGWVAKPIHGISEAWISLGAFLVFWTAGLLDKAGLKNNIDWGVLLFLGVLFSLPVVTAHLKVDRWMIEAMRPALSAFSFHPLAFLAAVTIVVYLVRIFLNKTPTVILFTLSLAPWAQDIGIHPGVLLISILIASDCWFLPYQTISYQIAYYSTDGKAFSHAQARKLMVVKFAVALLTLAVSIPYWRMLGLIR
jgi:anion transporter